MWSVFSVVAFLSIFESVFTQNQNETTQNQTSNDFASSGASFARNLTASISVSDADLATNNSDFPRKFPSDKVNISDRAENLETAEKRENVIEFNTPSQTNKTGDGKKLDHFRPSPQLEPYYEYNKFPVKPAYPEAKTVPNFGSITSDDRNSYSRGEVLAAENNEKSRNLNEYEPGLSSYKSSNNYQNIGGFRPGYPESTYSANGNSGTAWGTKNENTDDTPWVTRVRFPTSSSANNNPYPYVPNPAEQSPNCNQGYTEQTPPYPYQQHNTGNNVQSNQKDNEYLAPEISRPSNNKYLPPESNGRPTISTNDHRGSYLPTSPGFSSSGRGSEESRNRFSSSFGSSGQKEEFNFNKLIEIPKKYFSGSQNTYTQPHHKTYETSYNLMEKPPYDVPQKTYGGGYNPWKKILKLFATFIPIGLLISALTPTVINISNVNDTTTTQTSRYRSSDSKKDLQNHILSSLDYFDKLNENGCEYRVFCELLVSASSMKDSERHVENLLDNFAKQEIDYKSRAEDLKKVFEAVRNQDCNPISCEFIKNPT